MTINYSHFLSFPSNTWFPDPCCRGARVILVPDDSLELFRGHGQWAPASIHMSLPVLQSWPGAGLQPLLPPGSCSSRAIPALALSSTCWILATSCLPAVRSGAPLTLPGWAACPLQSCKHTARLQPLCLLSGKPLCGCRRWHIRPRAQTTLESLGNLAPAPLGFFMPSLSCPPVRFLEISVLCLCPGYHHLWLWPVLPSGQGAVAEM